MLLGILLGYVKHNASLFIKRDSNSLEFFVGDAELKPIYNKLDFFGEHRYSLLIVKPIQFVADFSHPETNFSKNTVTFR